MLRTYVDCLRKSTIFEIFGAWLGSQPQRTLWQSSILLKSKKSAGSNGSSSSDSDSDASELGKGVDQKLKKAAEQLALSVPTSQGASLQSDLLKQLQSVSKLSHDQAVEAPNSSSASNQAATRLSDLLSQMQVQRSVHRRKEADEEFSQPRPRAGHLHVRRQPDREKVKLFEGPALGIFTSGDAAQPTQEKVAEKEAPQERVSLWEKVHQEQLNMFRRCPPSNAFEEMIQWTEEGKMWQYPINNEQGLEEEAKVGFHQHMFLQDQIIDFPRQGPVRHFMELVLVGLSKNPYLTVQQKHEHINWFRHYFKEKEGILKEALGEDGVMASSKASS